MRMTPKINDMPTETRNRSIATLRPLITCTVMSGPLVIQGKTFVMKSTLRLRLGVDGKPRAAIPARGAALLLLLGRDGSQLRDLLAAPHELLAVELLNLG